MLIPLTTIYSFVSIWSGSVLRLNYYLILLESYRGIVMGVDHIVNKQNKNNSYTPKWLTTDRLIDIIRGLTWLGLEVHLLITWLIQYFLKTLPWLLGSYWRVRFLEVKKESCFSLFLERGRLILFSICLRSRTQNRWGLLKVLVGNFPNIFVFFLSHYFLNVFFFFLARSTEKD